MAVEESLERIYTIPLRDVKDSPRKGRADRAIRAVRKYLVKHMKADEVWIDAAVNQHLWRRGKYKIPSRIRVRAVLFDDGVVEVSLPEEDKKASMREALADAKEKKLEDVHKGEAEAEEKAEAEGAATPSGLTKPSPREEGVDKKPPEAEKPDLEDTEKKAPATASEKPAQNKPKPTEQKTESKKPRGEKSA